MKKMFWITKAVVLYDYTMILTFNDDSRRTFDFESLIENDNLYKPLKDKKLFENFKLDGWTVSWADGTIDIAPEYLYENSAPCYELSSLANVAEKQAHYGKQ